MLNEAGENEDASILPEEHVDETDSSEEPDKNESIDDNDLNKFLDSKKEKLQSIEQMIDLKKKEAGEEIKEMNDINDPGELDSDKIINIFNNEMFSDFSFQTSSLINKFGDGVDPFIKIIRSLEDGPFRKMTLIEKQALLDAIIEKSKNDENLVKKLRNYRETLKESPIQLNKVFQQLKDIENLHPAGIERNEHQLKYLNNLLDNDENRSIFDTLKTLYSNIIYQSDKDELDQKLKDIEEYPPWKQIEILNYLSDFYKDNKEMNDIIDEKLKSSELQSINNRKEEEEKGEPVEINRIFNEITGEDISISEFVDEITAGTPEENGEKKDIEDDSASTDLLTLQKVIQKNLTENDWSENSSNEDLYNKIDNLINIDSKKTIAFLESNVNSNELDPLAREVLLEKYSEIDDPAYQSLYSFHKVVDSTDDISEKTQMIEEFKEVFESRGFEINTFDNKLKYIKNEAKLLQFSNKLESAVGKVEDNKKAPLLKKIAGTKDFPEEVKKSAKKIVIASEENRFSEAFTAITSSSNSNEVKVQFLETLKGVARHKGWITDSPDDKVKNKIEDKITFYKNIISNRSNQKQGYIENRNDIMENLKKGKKVETINNEIKRDVKSKKLEKKDEKVNYENLPFEEKIFEKTCNIIKAYNDNIEALEPAVNLLTELNKKDFPEKILEQINIKKKQKDQLLNRTIEMIDSSNLDKDLIEEIHKSSPKEQFMWGESVIKNKNEKKLEDAFKPFLKNKKLPEEIDRIIKIIKNNNRNNFLKSSIENENSLVAKILENFEDDKLSKLKLKTRNRMDKDRITLFRDILKLTSD